MITIHVHRLCNDEYDLIRDIKLRSAEAGHKTAARFEFGRYEEESFWVLFHKDIPVYFSHAHRFNNAIRVGSKATQLGQVSERAAIPGRYKACEIYIVAYHQIMFHPGNEYVVTANLDPGTNSPKSHRVFRVLSNRASRGVNTTPSIQLINGVEQGVFSVDTSVVTKIYHDIENYITITS